MLSGSSLILSSLCIHYICSSLLLFLFLLYYIHFFVTSLFLFFVNNTITTTTTIITCWNIVNILIILTDTVGMYFVVLYKPSPTRFLWRLDFDGIVQGFVLWWKETKNNIINLNKLWHVSRVLFCGDKRQRVTLITWGDTGMIKKEFTYVYLCT